MPTRILFVLRTVATIAGIASCLVVQSARAQTIIDQWSSVTAPPPPPLKAVMIDKSTTALLMLDFNEQTCNPQRRPRCIASIPKVKTLLTAARTAGVPVVFSISGGSKAADIAKDLAPAANDPVISSGVDKFSGTDLEKILKDKGTKTVIVVGTAAHGAVLYTASGAAIRGMKVIVPVDGISAENTYVEQYVVWHLVNVPVIGPAFTLTTIDQVTF
ncbi:MAG: cysteine hydrolase [Betaproteobacteria bacterium]|nr:MAG: cysteine hydrolase [Betaproteobacteria bacterium]TMI03361.1 MAG: cysteine hydrolase [Betaproteobacteria bacterium]